MDAGTKIIKIGGHRAVVTYSARGYVTVTCAEHAVLRELSAEVKRSVEHDAAAWEAAIGRLEVAAIKEMRRQIRASRKS
ncbi:MAG: hypothetical protein IPJ61_19435 [Tessaracoccus sp.]|jgi:hypothetical protein|uniref:hypothetical protein n=1 Tax=Tessaracoccus sp. TaxID=1971211 RepID=UPI001EB18FCD|nr:hypothetical protein [Tessaracoccus sp.]MBK7823161.1 hypothetical protein [Tessaracoccus sp.]